MDENSFDLTQEGRFLKEKAESANEIEIVAVVDNGPLDARQAISLRIKKGFLVIYLAANHFVIFSKRLIWLYNIDLRHCIFTENSISINPPFVFRFFS